MYILNKHSTKDQTAFIAHIIHCGEGGKATRKRTLKHCFTQMMFDKSSKNNLKVKISDARGTLKKIRETGSLIVLDTEYYLQECL